MKIKGDGSVTMAEKGTTRAKCRHWYLRVETDHGRKQKRFTGTYSEAKAELAHFKASLTVPLGKTPFRECSERWLKRRMRSGNYEDTTIDKDMRLIRRLDEKFGDMPIGEITYSVAVDGILEIKESRKLGKTYTASLHAMLSRILDGAVRDGEIPSNPLSDIKSPKRDKSQRKALTYDQFKTFMRHLQTEPLTVHTVALRLLVFQGLRRGEAVGLNWDEVDLINKKIKIVRSVTDSGRLKEPKTMAGIRIVPMMHVLCEALKEWQAIQDEALGMIGIKQTVDTPVLTSIAGTRLNPQNLDRWWRKNRAQYGAEDIVLHELRHTFATLLTNSGAQLTDLPDIMGWTDVAMANVYVHSSEERARSAIDELERMLSGILE